MGPMFIKNKAMALLFAIIFISKLVSNVCKTLFVLLDTQNLLWGWLLTQNIWTLMKLNCVCFRIRMMFWLWYQESSKLNFYIKCKQRVEKNFEDLHCNKQNPFWFHKSFFSLQFFLFPWTMQRKQQQVIGGVSSVPFLF